MKGVPLKSVKCKLAGGSEASAGMGSTGTSCIGHVGVSPQAPPEPSTHAIPEQLSELPSCEIGT